MELLSFAASDARLRKHVVFQPVTVLLQAMHLDCRDLSQTVRTSNARSQHSACRGAPRTL